MAKTKSVRLASQPEPVSHRLPPGIRRQRIIDEGAAFFAEVGFSGRTRDLARRLGITQGLLYRYFPSKQSLIEAVLVSAFADRWDPAWAALLADRRKPLARRLSAFYRAYLARFSGVWMRLYVHAGLANLGFSLRHSLRITDRILRPLVAELRAEQGLPGFDERPMSRGERELAMLLHGGIVFIGLRKHIYGVQLPDQLGDLIDLQIDTFLAGAGASMRRLLTEPGHDSLTVRMLR